MRNRIIESFPNSVFQNHSDSNIFIADFTKRTGSVRHVEIHTIQPHCPQNTGNLMDCFKITNPSNHDLEFNVFDDNQFKDAQGKDIAHCEGCFYPSLNTENSWIVMLEIKDCSVRNMALYKKDVIDKIIKTKDIFKNLGIINKHNVYGIASFPRRNKTAFNDYIFGDIITSTSLSKAHGITFHATNRIEISEDGVIKFID